MVYLNEIIMTNMFFILHKSKRFNEKIVSFFLHKYIYIYVIINLVFFTNNKIINTLYDFI